MQYSIPRLTRLKLIRSDIKTIQYRSTLHYAVSLELRNKNKQTHAERAANKETSEKLKSATNKRANKCIEQTKRKQTHQKYNKLTSK